MKTIPSGPEGASYCERLGIPRPNLEAVAEDPRVKLFHLMVVALLERGEPMTLGEIADRLARAGVESNIVDLSTSLQKAWHGLAPVRRLPDGKLALDPGAWQLRGILEQAHVIPRPSPVPDTVPEVHLPSESVPLLPEEIAAACKDGIPSNLSDNRLVAALLDINGGAMTRTEIEACFKELSRQQRGIQGDTSRWTTGIAMVDQAGRFTLAGSPAELATMRRAVRALALPKLQQKAIEERAKEQRRAVEERLAEEHRQEVEEARTLRRALVRTVPTPDSPAAGVLLDIGTREIRTYQREALPELTAALAGYNFVVGLSVGETLHGLGVDPEVRRVVDLDPPQKTRRLNRAGRLLRITPEMLITATTRISRPLGDRRKYAEYLRNGETTKLVRRLESDAKALYAFHRYGALHNCVLLRWGFLDEVLGVEWGHPGDESLHGMLRRAHEKGREVDLVLGWAPAWGDPWGRAVRARIVSVGMWDVIIDCGRGTEPLELDEVQEARMVEDAAGQGMVGGTT